MMMLGATPKPDTAVGVTEMSMQSAQNALRPYIDKMKKIKEDMATGASQMIQLACKYDERARESYALVVGRNNLYTLLEAKYLPIQYGITMKARPDVQMRQSIIQAAAQALEAGRNGMPGLTYDQFLFIQEQVYSGMSLGELRLTIKKWVKKDAIQKQQEKERLVQLQAQENQKTIQMQTQSAEKIEQMKMEMMKVEKDLETRSKMLINNNQFMHDMDLLIAEYKLKLTGDATLIKEQAKVDANLNTQ
jgi:hypothetical protein